MGCGYRKQRKGKRVYYLLKKEGFVKSSLAKIKKAPKGTTYGYTESESGSRMVKGIKTKR